MLRRSRALFIFLEWRRSTASKAPKQAETSYLVSVLHVSIVCSDRTPAKDTFFSYGSLGASPGGSPTALHPSGSSMRR
jgi:hypothetical protein